MVASNVLTMTGEHKYVAGAASAGTFINVALSLLLVPSLGLVGVALGTLVATLIVNAMILIRACRLHRVRRASFAHQVIPTTLVPAGVQMALTWVSKMWLAPGNLFELALVAIPGVIAYGIVFWWFSTEPSEKAMIREILRPIVSRLSHRRLRWFFSIKPEGRESEKVNEISRVGSLNS